MNFAFILFTRPGGWRDLTSRRFWASVLFSASLTAHAVDCDAAPDIAESLSLSQAIAVAVAHNRDIKLSAASIKNAEANTIIANAAPNPTLTLQTVNINPRNGIGAGSLREKTVDTTVRIDQVIERGGKRGLRREAASHLESASRADFDAIQRQVRLNVAQAYYDLLAAQEKNSIAEETVRLADQTWAAARTRKKAGDLAGADVDRIAVDALRAKNDARQAAADLAKARIDLAVLVGWDPLTHAMHAADRWPEPGDVISERVIAKIIERRPDVSAARARVEAALSNRQLALASRTRDVSVGVQFEHAPTGDSNSTGSGNSYGVAVQIPLFVRYHYDGEIRAADAALDTARENLEKTREAARSNAYRALHDLRAAAERVHNFQDELLVAAGRAADAAEYSFKNGASGVMDVLDARRTYHATRLDALAARLDFAKSLAAWRTAVLEGFDQ